MVSYRLRRVSRALSHTVLPRSFVNRYCSFHYTVILSRPLINFSPRYSQTHPYILHISNTDLSQCRDRHRPWFPPSSRTRMETLHVTPLPNATVPLPGPGRRSTGFSSLCGYITLYIPFPDFIPSWMGEHDRWRIRDAETVPGDYDTARPPSKTIATSRI